MKRWIISTLVMLAVSGYAASEMLEHELAKARKHMELGKWNTAATELESVTRSYRDQPQELAEIKVLIASCQNSAGQYVASLKTLKSLDSLQPAQYRLEEARAYLGLDKNAEALNTLQYYGKDSGVFLEMSAAWVRAQAQMRLGQFRECMGSCGSIMWRELQADPKGLADMKISEATFKKLQAMKAPASELYYDAREAYDIKVYGIDFAVYRKAREAQFRGDYKKAVKLYEKIKNGTMKEAAGCYIGECYIALGDTQKAVQIYNKMIREAPYELYREEMMYKLVLIDYLEGRLGGALKTVENLREWFKKIEADGAPKVELKAVNEAVQRDIIAPAPKSFVQSDDCGNLIVTAKYPETINNRITSPWYLPNLKVRAELLYGFLLGEKKQKAEAASVYDGAPACADMQIISDRYAIGNLKGGLADGCYLFGKNIMKKIRKFETEIRLAGFLYLSDEKGKAGEMFDTVIRNAGIKYPEDLQTARLGKIYCLIAAKNDPEALKEIEPLIKVPNPDENPVVLEAKYLKACLLAKDKNTLSQALTLFQKLVGKRKNGMGDKALLALALTAVNNGKPDVAKNACRTLCSRFGGSPYSKPARTLAAALQRKDGKFPVGVIETDNGKVLVHRRVVVTPTNTDWESVREEMEPADIVIYSIKFVPRDDCEVVRSVWMRLTPDEPSPVDAIGDEICFVRAPMLFEKALMFDLRNIENK